MATITGTRRNDTLTGLPEDDVIRAGLGNDVVGGLGGRDEIFGEGGNDWLDGGADDDLLDGGDGFDILIGGDGNDRLFGPAGIDALAGGAGRDALTGGAGHDGVDGGDGIDTAHFSGNASGYQVTSLYGVTFVRDTNLLDGNDGIDALVRVERLRFADGATVFLTPNQGPVANAGDDAAINEGGTFNLLASVSDPDGDALSSTVDWGDGSALESMAIVGGVIQSSHVYAQDGVYAVTVSVSDGFAITTDTLSLTVNNIAPTVNAGADAAITRAISSACQRR